MMRLEDYDQANPIMATVMETTRITPGESPEEVRDIILLVDKKGFRAEIGQSIGVIAPGNEELGHARHFRLYTVANTTEISEDQRPMINICVRRCTYIDDYSGEEYKGIASNYLCDLQTGDTLSITGPHGLPWDVPDDKSTDMIMIGLGTGIAPFRAFVKHIYQDIGDWEGKIWLFHGAQSGLELLYRNNERDDFASYYDKGSFEAFNALSPRPHVFDPIALDYALEERSEEIWQMMQNAKTRVFVAGLENIKHILDKTFSKIAGSEDEWENQKSQLIAEKRYTELIY